MRIDVKGRNLPVSEELREHVAKRFRKVERQVSEQRSFSRPSAATRWSDTPNAPTRREPTPGATFRIGEDVVHARFGEGVVTGVEPGGVVIVRFASGGSEKKLMADYAPLKKT